MRAFALAVFVLLLSSIAFAQRLDDIGALLFRDVLKMTEYPGAPFTGNIVNDLVMMFFIPTVFIIVVVYTLAGRLTDTPKINLLLSIAFYAFIVFGGYFRIFALLAGPYFLFLLVVIGLFMFFIGHFGLRRAGGGNPHAGGGMPMSAVGTSAGPDTFVADLIRAKALTNTVNSLFRPGVDTRFLSDRVAELTEVTEKIKIELKGWGGAGRFRRMNPLQAAIEGHQHLNPDEIIRNADNALRKSAHYANMQN